MNRIRFFADTLAAANARSLAGRNGEGMSPANDRTHLAPCRPDTEPPGAR